MNPQDMITKMRRRTDADERTRRRSWSRGGVAIETTVDDDVSLPPSLPLPPSHYIYLSISNGSATFSPLCGAGDVTAAIWMASTMTWRCGSFGWGWGMSHSDSPVPEYCNCCLTLNVI